MFRAAEEYAAEHPDDFREIVDRFEITQKRAEGAENEFKAKDEAKAWREKGETAHHGEIEKRRRSSGRWPRMAGSTRRRRSGRKEEFPKRLLSEG
ncbi:MAG: hypothetical protein HYU36_03765 [Planctomycetes bacterium]|nr:hypothetical protein [Planctomycetota bacterium]